MQEIDQNSKIFNLPETLTEVQSLCVAKTILHSFCKISEESARNWKDYGESMKLQEKKGSEQIQAEEDIKNEESQRNQKDLIAQQEFGSDEQITKKLERKFDEWERKIVEESKELDLFIQKHEKTMKELSQNLDQKNEWLGDMVQKLEQMTPS